LRDVKRDEGVVKRKREVRGKETRKRRAEREERYEHANDIS